MKSDNPVRPPYRDARGRARTAKGHSANGRKTLPVTVNRLYSAWADPRLRRRWLSGPNFEITRRTPARSLRLRWEDGSRVQVLFYSKGDAKSLVTVDQMKLPDAATADRMRAYWRKQLRRLEGLLA